GREFRAGHHGDGEGIARRAHAFRTGQSIGSLSGATEPPETMKAIALFFVQGSQMRREVGTNSTKPEDGFGVVGTSRAASSGCVPTAGNMRVTKPTARMFSEGDSISTTLLPVSVPSPLSERMRVCVAL